MKLNRSFSVLFTLYFIVFLDALCVGIALPVMSFLFLGEATRFAFLSLDLRYFLLGAVVALAPLAQFFGAPFFGALSDHIGRKKVFIISLLAGILGYIIFAIGVLYLNLSLIVLGRILDGFAGGNYSAALAALSDLNQKKTQAKNFSRIAIAFGAGIVVGPIIGSTLADPQLFPVFNDATPFFFAAFLLFVNLLLVLFFFKETVRKRAKTPLTAFTGIRNLVNAFKLSYTRSLFLVVFLFSFANLLFMYFFQATLITLFHLTLSSVGHLLIYYVACLVVTQLFITPFLSRKFSSSFLLRVTLPSLAVSLLLFSLTSLSFLFFVLLFCIAVLQGVTYVSLLLFISGSSSKESHGEIFGINQSVESIANILSLLFAGLLAARHLLLPLWVASLLIILGWIIAFFYLKHLSKNVFREV